MAKPETTRLRYVSAKSQDDIIAFCNGLGKRIQIYGAPVWTGRKWFLWFVPNDDGNDIPSRDLD